MKIVKLSDIATQVHNSDYRWLCLRWKMYRQNPIPREEKKRSMIEIRAYDKQHLFFSISR